MTRTERAEAVILDAASAGAFELGGLADRDALFAVELDALEAERNAERERCLTIAGEEYDVSEDGREIGKILSRISEGD